jgi:hypothetical protein
LAQLRLPPLIFGQKRRIRELSALESKILNTLHGTKVCILWYYAKQSTKKMLCFNVILIFEPRKAEKVEEMTQKNGGQMVLRLTLATAAVGQRAYEKRGKYSKKSSWRVKMAYCRPMVVPFR